MGSPPQNPNWVFDYGVIDDILPSLDPPGFSWPDHSFAGPTAPGVEFDDSFGNPDSMKETGLRKREVATRLEIKAMPTFSLIRDGATVDKLVGANPEEIRKRIEGFLQSKRVDVA